MTVVVRRPSAGPRTHEVELLLDEADLKVAVHRWPSDENPREIAEGITVEPGTTLLWHLFPGRPYEVGAFHAPDGRLLGHYTNLVRPPEIREGRWILEDLCLDLWQPAGEEGVRVLDRDDLEAAVREGGLDPADAERAEALAEEIAGRAARGEWPPPAVRRWPLERVEELRLRRDEPGLYYANLVSNRVIAFGIYFLGAAALTTLAFAALGEGLRLPGPSRTGWIAFLGVEAVSLAAAALSGRLPATRRLRMKEVMSESTLFLGAAATGAAVLLIQESELWRTLLAAVYGTLGFFLGVFAVSRIAFDRRTPALALAGLLLCVLALVLLL